LIDLQLPRMVDPDWMAVAETPLAVEVPRPSQFAPIGQQRLALAQ